MRHLDRLIQIITDVAAGRYSNEVMDLTAPNVEEPVRTIAEAMELMMVKVEAREYHLEMLIKQLEEVNQKIRRNTIATVLRWPRHWQPATHTPNATPSAWAKLPGWSRPKWV